MALGVNDFRKPDWMSNPNIKPYVFVREENRIKNPGAINNFPWFDSNFEIIEPQHIDNSAFGKTILKLDELAFGMAGMTTPPWVFYDCGVMPGIVVGYAARTAWLPDTFRTKLNILPGQEWAPISLFIAIPTVSPNTWMSHNLASTNSFMEKEEQFKHLGFFTKAFGLWYANIERSYGITQWHSPALKLHPNYGDFELCTTYTPLHDYPNSVTYCLTVNSADWFRIVDRDKIPSRFLERFEAARTLDPKDHEALKTVQRTLEQKKHRFYLWGREILQKKIGDPLTLYTKK